MSHTVLASYERFLNALLSRDEGGANAVVDEALEAGEKPQAVYVDIVIAAHRELQRRSSTSGLPNDDSIRTIIWKELTRLKGLMNGEAKESDRTAIIVCLDSSDCVTEGRYIADMLTVRGWQTRIVQERFADTEIIELCDGSPDCVFIIPVLSAASIDVVRTVVSQLALAEFRPGVILADIGKVCNSEFASAVDLQVTTSEEALSASDEIFAERAFNRILNQRLKGIGSRVRSKREILRLSQSGLSKRCGLDRAYLSAIENGKQNITISALLKLSLALGVSFNELIGSREHEGIELSPKKAARMHAVPMAKES